MKQLTEYSKKELYDMSKLLMIKGISKMNKTELYESIKKYFDENYQYNEHYKIFMDSCHIVAYCEKDSSNQLIDAFKNQKFHIIDFKDLELLKGREFDKNRVKELLFFLDNGVYYICDNLEYSFLVIETEKYYGFIACQQDIEVD